MDKKWVKRVLGGVIPLAILVIGISYNSYVKMHTFTLSGDDKMKSEQIQPVDGKVKVTGTTDTEVVFTDIESGEKYSLQGTTQGRYLTGGVPPVRFSM